MMSEKSATHPVKYKTPNNSGHKNKVTVDGCGGKN